jgi:hypothetical protein
MKYVTIIIYKILFFMAKKDFEAGFISHRQFLNLKWFLIRKINCSMFKISTNK